MKKILLTLIVFLAFGGSIFAQYESHWPGFYDPDFEDQSPLVAAIVIDDEIVTAENHPDNWNALEIAFFYGDESRGTGFYLYNGYVEEFGDPFPVIDGVPVYFNTADQAITVKMYDHVNNIEYNECSVTYLGAPYTILTGGDHTQGWFDPENPIMLNFTTASVECVPIVLNEANPTKFFDFENDAAGSITEPYTGVTPACWKWTNLVSSEVPGHPTVESDTATQVYYTSHAHGSYSLRSYFRGITAMPELQLDEGVDMRSVKMSFWFRQPHWFYPMQVGVMTDPEDASTFVPVAYVDNGSSLELKKFEVYFTNYTGEGRYIAFKHIVPDPTSTDIHSVHYIDDITLELIDPVTECPTVALDELIDFEEITTLVNGATGVSPRCWDVVEGTPGVVPQVYHKEAYANSGNYSLRMVDRCVYAMPELAEGINLSNVQMELYVRQPNFAYQLEVGVWENGAFVPYALINNPDAALTRVFVKFTNYEGTGTPRIAFRNTLQQGVSYPYSYNYIDDIILTEIEPVDCSNKTIALSDVEDFESYTMTAMPLTGVEPDCWEVVDGQPVSAPQLYYKSEYAHSGNYSLRMVDRCVYAMPALAEGIDWSDVQMELYVRQPRTVYQLEVGVWDASTEVFKRVATINNSDDQVTLATVDFTNYTGSGRRIAFRNTLQQGVDYPYSYNYIDYISFVESKIANASGNVIYGDDMDADRYLNNIVVYPNPTTGNLYIDAMDVQKVECFNQMGQLVGVYDNANELNISDLSNGVYMLRITVPQGVTMRKVVKK